MPITRRQFELDIDTKTEEWMGKIDTFLAERKSEAFTLEELCQYFSAVSDEKQAFDLALEKLVETGVAEKRVIRDTFYYAYMEDIQGRRRKALLLESKKSLEVRRNG